MQLYLQYDTLPKNHLDRFDNWVKTFAEPWNRTDNGLDV